MLSEGGLTDAIAGKLGTKLFWANIDHLKNDTAIGRRL